MSDCDHCGHAMYWHERRREDQPDLFTHGPCLCGCMHMVPTTWSAA